MDFAGWHPPKIEWLILRWKSSDELATSSIYALVKFPKTVGFTDIGATIATQWWRHAFYISPIFSKSQPKFLKWSYVPSRLHVDHFDCEVLNNSMRAFSNESGLNIFYGKMKDSPWFLLISQDQFFRSDYEYLCTTYETRGIGLLTTRVSFNLLELIPVATVLYNVLILFILHKTVPLLLQKV